MLSHFPQPYPDELLYSIFARYQARMQYPSGRAVVIELFNNRNGIAVVDLPSHLDRLLGNMPPGHRYTAKWLMERHTTLPFYAPFLSPERLQQVQQDMRGAGGPGIQMRVGLMASSIPYPTRMRFCPRCVAADRSQFAETYWHRLHQLSGIMVCPEHQIFLADSDVLARNAQTRYLFTVANNVVDDNVPVRPLNSANPEHRLLLQLAADAAWLLAQSIKAVDPTTHRQRYLTLLAEQELATYTGQLRLTSLVEKFNEYYTPKVLKKLHSSLNPAITDNWLARLIRRPETAQHPLHHLLLIRFLEYSAADFFKLTAQSSHFGVGPWPCLNPTCSWYRQPIINTCHIHYSRDSCRPVGAFACRCGFEYIRVGPDHTPDDRFRLSRVTRYGRTWEDCLRRLWPDPTVSLRGLARQLGVDPKTATKQAVRLGLPFPRPDHRGGQKPAASKNVKRQVMAEQTQAKRQHWLSLLAQYPTASLNELRTHGGAIFIWLYRHDHEWLKQHKPQTKPPQLPAKGRVDWARRDIAIAVACLQAALQIVKAPGNPKQLTQTAITRRSGHNAVIRQHSGKIPHTIAVLKKIVESRQDFALRRIEWAAAEFVQAGTVPKQWQLIRHSGTDRVKHWPLVRQTLDRTMTQLQEMNNANQPSALLLAVRDSQIEKISALLREE